MIFKACYIFSINLVTYGGGGVYIPVYESYYVDIFNLMTSQEYYNVVSILNVIPGVTGGKLAGYAMYLEYGIFGMLLGIFLFASSGILLVLTLEKLLSNIREHKLFKQVNANIKPVVVGILLTITYNFYEIALAKIDLVVVLVLTMITWYLLASKKIKMYNLVVIYLIFSIIINLIIL